MPTLLQAAWRLPADSGSEVSARGGPKYPRLMYGGMIFLLTLAVAIMGRPAPAVATEVPVRLLGGGTFDKKVEDFKARRFRKVVHQSLDFSCGAATLATLLRYHYGQSLDERAAIIGMFNQGEKEKIRQRGFSMLDMKHYAQSLGYQAEGYKIEDINKLLELKIPVITLINTKSYYHFVIIRQTTDKFVYLSDPSWGHRKMTWDEFGQAWQKVILVVVGPTIGSPEGLYSEADEVVLPKDQVIRAAGVMGSRFSMDPTMAIWTSQRFGDTIPNAFLIPSSAITR